jgi:hypothetical protein
MITEIVVKSESVWKRGGSRSKGGGIILIMNGKVEDWQRGMYFVLVWGDLEEWFLVKNNIFGNEFSKGKKRHILVKFGFILSVWGVLLGY